MDFSVSELICQFPSVADLQRKILSDSFENLLLAFQSLVKGVVEDLHKRGSLTNLDEVDNLDRTFLTQVMNRTLPGMNGQEYYTG